MAPFSVRFIGTCTCVPSGPDQDITCMVLDHSIMIDTGWNGAINMLAHGEDPNFINFLFMRNKRVIGFYYLVHSFANGVQLTFGNFVCLSVYLYMEKISFRYCMFNISLSLRQNIIYRLGQYKAKRANISTHGRL